MTWKWKRKKKQEELPFHVEFAQAPLPGCAGGLLCGLRSCAGVLLRGSVASKLQVGTRGVCHCVSCFRVFLLCSGEAEWPVCTVPTVACPGTRTRTTPPVTCRLTWLRSACSSRRLRVAAFSGCAAKVLRAARRVSPSACSQTSVLDLKAIRSPTARIVRPGRRSVAYRHRSWTNVQAGQR